MFEPTITLSIAQILVVLVFFFALGIVLMVGRREQHRHFDIKLNTHHHRFIIQSIFDQLSANLVERFQPVMNAYEQCKKDNAEMRKSLSQCNNEVADLMRVLSDRRIIVSRTEDGRLVSMGWSPKPLKGQKYKKADLMEITVVPKTKKRRYDTSPEAKAKRAEKMRAYRARVKKQKS